jgi:hypothetical protein
MLVLDPIAHTPPEVLAKNFEVPVEAFRTIPVRYHVTLQVPSNRSRLCSVSGEARSPSWLLVSMFTTQPIRLTDASTSMSRAGRPVALPERSTSRDVR